MPCEGLLHSNKGITFLHSKSVGLLTISDKEVDGFSIQHTSAHPFRRHAVDFAFAAGLVCIKGISAEHCLLSILLGATT